MNRQPGYIDGRRARVGNVPIWGPVPSVPIPGTMEAYGIFDDFTSVEDLAAAGSTPTGKATWEYKIQNACALAQGDGAGGIITFTCGGADNDSGQVIMGSLAGGGAFKLAAGKHLWYEARFKSTNIGTAKINLFAGLKAPEDTILLENNGDALTVQNMLGFVIRDTETKYSFVGRKAAAEDYNDLLVALDTDYHYFGFYVNGVTNVAVYLDRTLITDGTILTDNIPVTGLMPAFAIKAGDTNAEILTVDYVMCVQLR